MGFRANHVDHKTETGDCREQQCLDRPRAFLSDHSRFLYFRKAGRDPDYHAYDDTVCEVVLLSGLPGAGKDSWLCNHLTDWPVISLDAIRQEMNISPTDKQGAVIAEARARARDYLRQHRSFVWNATNITRQMRNKAIDLFAAYRARVRIVYLETGAAQLFRQNRQRQEVVPHGVLNRLIEKWEMPDRTEAHQVDWLDDSAADC